MKRLFSSLLLALIVFAGCSAAAPGNTSVASSSAQAFESSACVADDSTSVVSMLDSSALSKPDNQPQVMDSTSQSESNEALPFYIGIFEYIIAEPWGEDAPNDWAPIVYILKLEEDGSAKFIRHYAHSEWLAVYEGQFTCEVDSWSARLVLDLECTYLENSDYRPLESGTGEKKHTELLIGYDGPPENRYRVSLISGDTLFDTQRESWPNWFMKLEGEYSSAGEI